MRAGIRRPRAGDEAIHRTSTPSHPAGAERRRTGGRPPGLYAPPVAARRLIILMLALLVASSVAAALVPVDPDRLRDTSTTSTATAGEPLGDLVRRKIDAGRDQPSTVAIALGDQLALTVTSDRPDLVEIPGLGELEDVDPDSPATFDLRPFQPGTYPVRLLDSGQRIARIVVTAGEPGGHDEDAAK